PVFRRRRFFQGRPIKGSNIEDIAWLRPDGQQMCEEDWNAGLARTVGIFLNGRGIPDHDDLGERIIDDSFLLLINAYHRPLAFTLPDSAYGRSWEIVVDTTDPLLANARRKQRDAVPGGRLRLQARAMLVLRCRY
ncbi:MAG: glycogen debranching enzyme, partial [Mycobacteriales bacterium]